MAKPAVADPHVKSKDIIRRIEESQARIDGLMSQRDPIDSQLTQNRGALARALADGDNALVDRLRKETRDLERDDDDIASYHKCSRKTLGLLGRQIAI